MRKIITLLLVPGLFLLISGCSQHQHELEKLRLENAALKEALAAPPASLNKHYPPEAQTPVYLLCMFELATSLNAIGIDLFQQDMEHVQADFDLFSKTYKQLASTVPEWAGRFSYGPVDSLGMALASHDQQKVMAAFEEIGKVCADCHHVNMPKVQYTYHWGNVDTITVVDPLIKQQISFGKSMQLLDMSFTGIAVDAKQGQLEQARQHFQGFTARFAAMKTTCKSCHNTERKYYIDKDVESLIQKLGTAIRARQVNQQQVQQLSAAIGNESCMKCHLVHVPPVFAREQWSHAVQ